MIANELKMIIWDLDDTFWMGTLAEGPVSVPRENIDLVKTLARRGIISSICSKNDHSTAQRLLEEHDVWSYFVFPEIQFAPKGAAVSRIIDRANLRPDNVLFIDDSRLNLEEARYLAPNLMTALPAEIVPRLLSLPQARGKADEKLSRLHQYKQLERKLEDRQTTELTNLEFLRQCDIQVEIDLDVEGQLDRVVELINRSNQLNFTKVRLDSKADVAKLQQLLRTYGYHAGVVKVSDKYGDYGVVGFFMAERFAHQYRLLHFVFSCRIMNMGVEQYIYQLLGQPECTIVGPVSNGLTDFSEVDWISSSENLRTNLQSGTDSKLLFVGGCDLLQAATYCSTNRAEYVNVVNRGVMVRYDDPGFILTPREAIATSQLLRSVPCWTKEDVARFDSDVADSETIIVSLWEAINGDYMLLEDKTLLRLAPSCLADHLGRPEDGPYLHQARFFRLSIRQKLQLVERSLEQIALHSPNASVRLALGANTRGAKGRERRDRKLFNKVISRFCERRRTYRYVSLDDAIPESEILNPQHFTRKGYFALASALKAQIAQPLGVRFIAEPVSEAAGFYDVLAHGTPLQFLGGKMRRHSFNPIPAVGSRASHFWAQLMRQ